MTHRHLVSDAGWSKAAIDSALERGSLAEWRELFEQVERDREFAAKVLEVARQHPIPGVLPIVNHLVELSWPTSNP
jgi:hypothetical protein